MLFCAVLELEDVIPAAIDEVLPCAVLKLEDELMELRRVLVCIAFELNDKMPTDSDTTPLK